MKCEVCYCIYNRDFLCILKETQLNSLGMCEECIIISIPTEILEVLKENQLKNLEEGFVN